ncbi:MAG: SpoIIE family protein phosphatase [Halanaerobiaceae bacterium]
MEQTGIIHGIGSCQKSNERAVILKFVAFALPGFFIGQAEIFSGMYILSLIYWSMFVGAGTGLFFLVTLSTAWGLVFSGPWTNIFYLAAGVFAYVLYDKIKIGKQGLRFSVLTALFHLIFFAVFFYWQGSSLFPFYYLKLIESAMLVLFLGLSCGRAVEMMNSSQPFVKTDRIVLFLAVAGILTGFSNFPYWTEHSLVIINVFVLLLAIGLNWAGGAEQGVMGASLLGVLLYGLNVVPVIALVKYIIFSGVTGYFNRRNRWYLSLSAIFALLIYSGFLSSVVNIYSSVVEILLVILVVLCVPKKFWLLAFSRFSGGNDLIQVEQKKVDGRDISELSDIFSGLSETFREAAVGADLNHIEDFAFLFRSKNCQECLKRKKCWQQEEKNTYEMIKKLVNIAEKRGHIIKEDLEECFSEVCPYISRIYSGCKDFFKLYQVNKFWKNKLLREQRIVSEQLEGVSQIVDDLARGRKKKVNLDRSLRRVCRRFNSHQGIDIENLKVGSEIEGSRFNLIVELEPCHGNDLCRGQLLRLINGEFSGDYRLVRGECGNVLKDKLCFLEYGPVGNFSLSTSFVQEAVEGDVSGDTYLYKPQSGGSDLLILSDGMGVGRKAARESRSAISLFENLVDAGFGEELVLKTVNSALFFRSRRESFTTMDVSIFDTFTGKLKIYKIGAVSTFIKRGWDVWEINSSSLPAGIIENINIEHDVVELQDGDFVIMISDGVLDANRRVEDKISWFKQLLMNSSFEDSADFANYIAETVRDYSSIDDRTVIVARVDKK